MGDKSRIEWTDATWNPVTGCSKVSPGCAHCYAETLALTRLAGSPGYGGDPWTPENAAVNVVLRPERLDQPLRWKRPRRVFVNSMSDLFHELVPFDYIDRVFGVMQQAPHHTFQVLTKRPERMQEYVSGHGTLLGRAHEVIKVVNEQMLDGGPAWPGWPLPNVWLGTSVENQHWAEVRIPQLLATPAAIRFLSCEPLLGPIDFSNVTRRSDAVAQLGKRALTGIDWVIAGGESGPQHRPVDLDWVRSLRDQCVAAGVAFMFKQVGGRTSKAGGRELDGRSWDEFPLVVA
jgi:protein gp37